MQISDKRCRCLSVDNFAPFCHHECHRVSSVKCFEYCLLAKKKVVSVNCAFYRCDDTLHSIASNLRLFRKVLFFCGPIIWQSG